MRPDLAGGDGLATLGRVGLPIAYVALIYAGIIRGLKPAENVLLFVIWVRLGLMLSVALSVPYRTALRATGRISPRWIGEAYMAVLSLFLVGSGWWYSAVATVVVIPLGRLIYGELPEAESADLGASGNGAGRRP